jgi:hypothetical protein
MVSSIPSGAELSKLVIKTGKNAGKHPPSVASVYRALADDDASGG